MKISIKRDDLIKPLSHVAGIVEKRQTLPVLSNILIKNKGDKIELTGTDLEVEIVTTAPCKSSEEGETTLPARKLLDICRSLPSGSDIKIEVNDDKAIVKSGRSRFSLLTMPVADFPNLETSNWETEITIEQKDLKGLLERTQFCMAQQDVRYYLNGLLFEIKNNTLKTVATDGHRMAISEIKLTNNDSSNIEKQVIVPRKGVLELIRFLEDNDVPAVVQINPNHIRVKAGNICLTSKLIDGRFPDYNQVIPVNQTKIINLEKEAFKETLQRTAILSNEKYRGIRFQIKEKIMTVSAHNPEQEEAQEEIPIDYDGDEMEIGFNSNYIVDAVTALKTKEVEFALSDANSSSTICSPGDQQTKYVVMPMRL